MIGAVFAAALFAAPAPGQGYVECLTKTMAALEPSGEPATAIALATTTACAALETKPAPDNRLGAMTPQDQRETLNFLRQVFSDRIVTHIVRLRACRHTPGCTPAMLPPPFGSNIPSG